MSDAEQLRALADWLDVEAPIGDVVVPTEVPPPSEIREIADRLDAAPPVSDARVKAMQLERDDIVVIRVSESTGADAMRHMQDAVEVYLRRYVPGWGGSVLVVPGKLSVLHRPAPPETVPVFDKHGARVIPPRFPVDTSWAE